MAQPKISCLIVTQAGRWPYFVRACAHFARQTWPNKELVIACAGPADYNARLESFARESGLPVRFAFCPVATPIGALRAATVNAATGEIICQWDDDDQYHPRRLAVQAAALEASGCDYGYLCDQLQFFEDTRELYWVDWARTADGARPASAQKRAIPNTIIAWRERMIPYQPVARNEDSDMMRDSLLTRTVHLGEGLGWCYLYVCHGSNMFSRRHHHRLAETHRVFQAQEIHPLLARADAEHGDVSDSAKLLGAYEVGGVREIATSVPPMPGPIATALSRTLTVARQTLGLRRA